MDNFGGTIVPWLFLTTFVIVIAIAVVQWRKARKAQREHHRSVQAEVQGEPPGATSAASGTAGGAASDRRSS